MIDDGDDGSQDPNSPTGGAGTAASTDDTEARKLKEKILQDNVKAAKRAREDFITLGRRVEAFGYGKDEAVDAQLAGLVPFKVKVAKTAQAIEIFVPELYQANPHRRVEPRPWADPSAKERASLMELYLNYTPGEMGLADESRRAVQEGVVYGRGVMWTGWDPTKRLVTSVFDNVSNYLIDPDARQKREANWKGRIRVKPRWWLMERYPDMAEKIRGIDQTSKVPTAEGKKADFTTDQIVFYELYYKIGLFHYREGQRLLSEDEAGKLKGDDSPVKYILTESGVLLAELPWEVPYYLDNAWPCEELDFRERPGSLWPESVLGCGLPHQEALNYMYQLYLAKARVACRTLVAVMTENGTGLEEEEVKKALYGDGLYEVLNIVVNGAEGKKLGDFLQTLNLSSGVEELQRWMELVGKEFEKATGLYEILYYGDTQRQIRSAAEVEMKDRNSRSRLVDMRDRVEQWATRIARKEAIAARFLHNAEDITRLFGEQAGQAWGFLMPPQAVEQQNQEQALLQQGAPPDVAKQIGAMHAKAIVMDRAQRGGIEFEQLMLEVDYSIEAGSMRRRDFDQRVDAANEAMNQLVPTLLQSGAQLPAVAIMFEWAQANGMSGNVLDALQGFQQQLMAPPPMPMQGPPGQGAPPQGGPPQPGQPAPPQQVSA